MENAVQKKLAEVMTSACDTLTYNEEEIEELQNGDLISRQKPKKKVTSVDKANVLGIFLQTLEKSCGRGCTGVSGSALEHMLVDNLRCSW